MSGVMTDHEKIAWEIATAHGLDEETDASIFTAIAAALDEAVASALAPVHGITLGTLNASMITEKHAVQIVNNVLSAKLQMAQSKNQRTSFEERSDTAPPAALSQPDTDGERGVMLTQPEGFQ